MKIICMRFKCFSTQNGFIDPVVELFFQVKSNKAAESGSKSAIFSRKC